jgi:signal transduction histidine kinase
MSGAPASFLVSAVPAQSLRDATGPLGPEAFKAGLQTLAVIGAIALGSAFLVRANLRASRLRETETYLARIREEWQKQRALLEAAADLILIIDPADHRLRDSNPRALEVLGAREENTQDAYLRLGNALGAEGEERLKRGIQLAAEQIGSPILVPSLRLRTVSGESMDVDARCIGIAYAGERLVELSLSDRTKEREMERRVIIAERMSALGLLTAGVAHEINNPLEAIGNYLSLIERPGIDEARRSQYLEKVSLGWKRIRDIVSELLRFARTDGQEGDADLARTVERATSMARWSEKLREVRIEVQGLDAPMLVPGNEGKLEQVLLNLLLNAGRAMEGKGRIRIVAEPKDSTWVELSVQDEGPGIDKADLGRIFDPFFTKTGGTGLGLAVSYGIVQAHGGELTAENVPGGGACFRVLLPRRRGSSADRTHGLANIV